MSFAGVAALTFVIVLVLILGIYALVIVLPERRAHSDLQRRMKPEKAAKKKSVLMPTEGEGRGEDGRQVSALSALVAYLARPARQLLERAGVRLAVPVFLLLIVWASGMGFILLWLATGRLSIGAVLGPWTGAIPYLWVRMKADKRMWKFEEQFPEAVDLVSRALRAGHALPTAIGMVAGEVPDPVGTEFKKLYDQQNFGMGLNDALRAFASRVPVLDARFFVTAVITQREAGGNLAGVLDNLASVVRERFKIKRQVRVISAHGRMTAMILSGLPPVLAFLTTMMAPDQMGMLIEHPIGIRMIMAAIVLQVTGMLIMRKIVNVEI
jgi:tight adherence protein B